MQDDSLTIPALFFQTVVDYSTSILPWFLLGMVAAFGVETLVRPAIIRRYFGKASGERVALALVLGMISPLSILSFLPVASEFVALGFNPGVLFSFLLAERAYDLQSLFILTSLFGFKLAFLNASAILGSLLVVAHSLRKIQVRFAHSGRREAGGFFVRQLRLLAMVMTGIVVGALVRAVIPQGAFQALAASRVGGLVTALILGLVFYFGPILGNYPVAKAFADLGMSPMGVFGFLTVSPVFNLVVISLFGAAVGLRTALRAVLTYALTAVILTVFASLFL